MSRKKSKKRQNKKQQKKPEQQQQKQQQQEVVGNNVVDTCPGCHIAHDDGAALPAWVLAPACEEFVAAEFGLSSAAEEERMPELSVDPEEGTLTLTNKSHSATRAFFVSLDHPATGRGGKALASGEWRDKDGAKHACVTLVVVLQPRRLLEVCTIDSSVHLDGSAATKLALYSTISDVLPPPTPPAGAAAAPPPLLGFPLAGPGPFLCSQGAGGCFTHFYPATAHAIDLACPLGTPVTAVGAGTVVEVKDSESASGIHASLLFRWNSLMLHVASAGLYVEYVHIAPGSAKVAVGDTVAAGEVLCTSGDVGFCPVPHLHIQAHRSRDKDAPTVPFRFAPSGQCAASASASAPSSSGTGAGGGAGAQAGDGGYLPKAGGWYPA